MANNKLVKQFLESIDRTKWTITRAGNGHYRLVYHKGGAVSCSATPSDDKFYYMVQRDMRRVEREKA